MSDGLSQNDIDSLLAAAADMPDADGVAGEATGAPGVPARAKTAQGGHAKSVRTMDFSRPAKFNKDQLRTLQMLHEAFCRRISTYLSGTVRTLAEVSVSGAEQLPYGDFVDAHPAPNLNAVLELSPLGTNAMLVADLPLMFGIIDRMLGGQGASHPKVRELTDIETKLTASIIDSILYELTQSWSELVDVAFRLRGIEMNSQFAQVAATSEPSVVVNFNIVLGTTTGRMALCLPYRAIEDVVGDLTAHRYFSQGEDPNASRDGIRKGLSGVTMPVRAIVGEVDLPVDTVLSLEQGDVIPLGRRIEDGLTIMVGNTRTYRAFPGREGKRLAVRIDGMEQLAERDRRVTGREQDDRGVA